MEEGPKLPPLKLLTEKQKELLYVKAKEYGLTHDDMIDIINEFGYTSFGDIPADRLDDILNVIPEYAERKSKEILNEFREIF